MDLYVFIVDICLLQKLPNVGEHYVAKTDVGSSQEILPMLEDLTILEAPYLRWVCLTWRQNISSAC